MKKKLCFLFVFIVVSLAVKAQQDPQFSFYKQASLVYNPGFAGTSNAISALLLNRTQWSGLDGAPTTSIMSVETATNLFGIKSGVGLNIIRDELGFEENTLVNLNYTYLVQTSIGDLGIGTALGFFNKAINGDWYIPADGGNWYIPPGSDGLMPGGSVSEVAFDLGLGMYLRSNDYFASLSVTHINEGEISFENDAYTFYTRHYYFSGGYTIQMPNALFTLQPSFLYKTDLAGSQLDLHADVTYDQRFTGGIGYRLNDGLIFKFSFELANGLKAGYAYDLTTSALGGYSNGSHELFLFYSFAFQKGRNKKYKSVRYL